MSRKCLALILAAGEGTRMQSTLPKVLHKVAGISMLQHVMRVSKQAECENISVVAGNGFEIVSKTVSGEDESAQIFAQTERLGTAHAALAAKEALEKQPDDVLVLFGDTPLVKPQTLKDMRQKLDDGAAVVVLGFRADDPTGYGRLLEKDGKLLAIREHAEASDEERQIDFCNGGIMGFSGEHALKLLEEIGNDNAKGEYYLTDAIEIANAQGLVVEAMEADEQEIMGVNTKPGLAEVEAIWQKRTREAFMLQGVTMIAPESIYLQADTKIEKDVVMEPNIFCGPEVEIKQGAFIKGFSHLEGCVIGEGTTIGPFARLRPGTKLGKGSRVGNFVEIKNADIQDGAKVNHLSYIGDAEIGIAANIGAGTITCNYDGLNKHKTVIGQGAFIGSNSALVAPVSIGDGAYVGSGSVITDNVPDNALGIARGKQVNKPDMANAIRVKIEEFKKKRS